MITLICLVLVFCASYMLFKEYVIALRGCKIKLKKTKDDPLFAVLIPARDESLVISDLLDSLKKQTYKVKSSDIYIIVESEKDPTVMIANSILYFSLIDITYSSFIITIQAIRVKTGVRLPLGEKYQSA